MLWWYAAATQHAAAAYASIASPQRVWKWKGEGIIGVHGHGARERAHATARDTPDTLPGGTIRSVPSNDSLLQPTTVRKQRHLDIRDTAATPVASHT